jgi:hypothetical protein
MRGPGSAFLKNGFLKIVQSIFETNQVSDECVPSLLSSIAVDSLVKRDMHAPKPSALSTLIGSYSPDKAWICGQTGQIKAA